MSIDNENLVVACRHGDLKTVENYFLDASKVNFKPEDKVKFLKYITKADFI